LAVQKSLDVWLIEASDCTIREISDVTTAHVARESAGRS
jgi:hypothetical protein